MAKYKKKLDADIRGPLEYGLTIFGGKSGEYPQKLYKALMNSQTVLTVWDDARLVGLIRVLDDCTSGISRTGYCRQNGGIH